MAANPPGLLKCCNLRSTTEAGTMPRILNIYGCAAAAAKLQFT